MSALGIEAVEHDVIVDVVLQRQFDGDVVIRRVNEIDADVGVVVAVLSGGCAINGVIIPSGVTRRLRDQTTLAASGVTVYQLAAWCRPASRQLNEVLLALLGLEPACAGGKCPGIREVECCLAEYCERLPVSVIGREPPRVGRCCRNTPAVGDAVVVAHRAGVGAAGIGIIVIGSYKGGTQKLRIRTRPVVEALRGAVTALVSGIGSEIPLFVAIFPECAYDPVYLVACVGEAEFLCEAGVFLIVGQETNRVAVPIVSARRLEAVNVVRCGNVIAERAEVRHVIRGVLVVYGVALKVSRCGRETQVIR